MNEKMMKTAKTLDTVAKIFGGIAQAVGIVFFVFALLVLILGEKMVDASSMTLDLDFVKLSLAEEYQAITPMIRLYVVVGLVIGGGLCELIAFAVAQVRGILQPIQEGRPFENVVPDKLKKIAWISLAAGAFGEIASVVERMIAAKAYPMDAIFASSAITGIEYSYTVDFGFVFVFAILMLLSYVFRYGSLLQQESDETL